MLLSAISPLGSIARIGGKGIGWLRFWNLRRGSGRRSDASAVSPRVLGLTVSRAPAAAAGPLRGFLEADETFIGGRGDPTSRARSTANPDKSLVVAAGEKVPAPKNQKGKHGHAVKRQHGFFAGNGRIAVLPGATGAELGAF